MEKKLGNTFSSFEKLENNPISYFLLILIFFHIHFKSWPNYKITCQIMLVHNILFVLLRIQLVMHENSTFTEYGFAFLLPHSVKLNFGKRNMHEILNLVILNEHLTTLDLKLHVSSPNHIITQYLQFT